MIPMGVGVGEEVVEGEVAKKWLSCWWAEWAPERRTSVSEREDGRERRWKKTNLH